MSGIVRQGSVGFKEDAFASWIWRDKWLVLREQSLSVHKNEVSFRFRLCGPPDMRGDPGVTSFVFARPFFTHTTSRFVDAPRFRCRSEQSIEDETNESSH